MIAAIRYGLEFKAVLCTDKDDLPNLDLDSLLKISKSNEDQNPSGWSGTPQSGKNLDPGLKSVDSDAKLTSGAEEKISIDKKANFKQNSFKPTMSLNSDYDFIADEIGLGKEEATTFKMDNKILKLAEISDSKSESSPKKDVVNVSFPYFKKPNEN